jgi:hypothetical protein
MSLPAKAFTTLCFFLVLVGLGYADMKLTARDMVRPNIPPTAEGSEDSGNAMSDGSSSAVTKQDGPDVLQVLAAQNVSLTENSETSLIRRVLPPETNVQTRTLLREGDRLAFISWADTTDAKLAFTALKQALLKSFSNQVRDLDDRNEVREGKPTRNVLTFVDPTISAERLIFVRVRERIFEFHVPEGKFNQVMSVVDALTE